MTTKIEGFLREKREAAEKIGKIASGAEWPPRAADGVSVVLLCGEKAAKVECRVGDVFEALTVVSPDAPPLLREEVATLRGGVHKVASVLLPGKSVEAIGSALWGYPCRASAFVRSAKRGTSDKFLFAAVQKPMLLGRRVFAGDLWEITAEDGNFAVATTALVGSDGVVGVEALAPDFDLDWGNSSQLGNLLVSLLNSPWGGRIVVRRSGVSSDQLLQDLRGKAKSGVSLPDFRIRDAVEIADAAPVDCPVIRYSVLPPLGGVSRVELSVPSLPLGSIAIAPTGGGTRIRDSPSQSILPPSSWLPRLSALQWSDLELWLSDRSVVRRGVPSTLLAGAPPRNEGILFRSSDFPESASWELKHVVSTLFPTGKEIAKIVQDKFWPLLHSTSGGKSIMWIGFPDQSGCSVGFSGARLGKELEPEIDKYFKKVFPPLPPGSVM